MSDGNGSTQDQGSATSGGGAGDGAGAGGSEEVLTLSKQDLESLIDRRVSGALKTREDNLRAEFEQERRYLQQKALEAEGKFEELSEERKRDLEELQKRQLDLETNDLLRKSGMSDFADIFKADFATLDGRATVAEELKTMIQSAVEKELKTRLKSEAPGKASGGAAGSGADSGDLAEQIAAATQKANQSMSPQDWAVVRQLQHRQMDEIGRRAKRT